MNNRIGSILVLLGLACVALLFCNLMMLAERPVYQYHAVYDATYGEVLECRTNVRTGVTEVMNHGIWTPAGHEQKWGHVRYHREINEPIKERP